VGFYSNLALVQVLQGKTGESEANLEKASVLVDPQSPPPAFVSTLRELSAAYYQSKNYQKAIESYSRLLLLYPADTESRSNFADALFRVGRNDEALRQIQMFVTNKPNDANARNLMGAILLTMGKREEAAVQFEAALKLNPDHSDAKTNLFRAKGGE
jgi:tetratricopeptide (TPR) repeat protein